jgi:zinc D-Ala-D-Ala carboxypeptidase
MLKYVLFPLPFARSSDEASQPARRHGPSHAGKTGLLGGSRATYAVLTGMNAHLAALGISLESLAARGLRECEEARELQCAEIGTDGKEHLLVPGAAEAWRTLRSAANSDGITLFIVSAFRSIDRQAEIVRGKLDTGIPIKDALTVCAPPGFSEHHTGRAVDLSTHGCRALETEFDQTTAYAWLKKRAGEFGYRLSYPIGNPFGYQYEPWHWCFRDARSGSTADAQGAQPHA